MADDEKLRIEYIPLSQAVEWDWEENPKSHDIGSLVISVWRYGFQDPPKFSEALGRFVYGNGRVKAVAWGRKEGREPPKGILVENGEWLVPVKFGVDLANASEAKAFAIDHNSLTMMGGDGFTPFDIARMYDQDAYLAVLAETAAENVLPVSVDGDDMDALTAWLTVPNFQPVPESEQPRLDQKKPVECPECGASFVPKG